MLINTLFEAFISKPYKVCGYEKNESSTTIVKYTLKNKRAGSIYRKSAKDILLDSSLKKNFDYDDIIEIASLVQRDEILKSGNLEFDVLTTYQRSNQPLYKFYPYIVAITAVVWCFCALLGHRFLSLNFLSIKIILPGAIVIFPVIYFMADLIQEVYGYARLRQALWICISTHITIGILTSFVMSFTPAQFVNEDAYSAVMNTQWSMIIGNAIGMIAGFSINGIVLAKLKIKFAGKNLWLRTIVSTLIAEFVYSYVCSFIGFHKNLHIWDLLKLQFSMVMIKVMWEIFATPFLYITSTLIKNKEGIDVYDYYTNFNPFSWSV